MMQKGRGGMGTHKHFISGHAPVNARYKAEMSRLDNAERQQQRFRIKSMMYPTVQEAFAAMRRHLGMPWGGRDEG